jgi:ABC-2 type transport system permease protein
VSDIEELRRLQNVLTQSVVEHRLTGRGLDPQAIKEWTRRVKLKEVKIVKGVEKKGGFGREFLTSFSFAMMLYMVIVIFGVMVMRGVMEEKSSRMVELLLSSVKPVEMMIGKIVGIGLASLTQVGAWMATAALVSTYGGAMMGGDAPFTIEPGTVAYFAVFFILGYFLYATLYAVVGSVCSSEQDAQHLQILVVLPLMVPIFVMMFVMRHPEATASVVLSLIPFFSPVLMFVRINVLTPPAVEILGSILILVATIGAVVLGAARIYRVGILMYGKRATLPEIVHWLRHGA